jgi:alkylation response protein AidB-like acyl-CoA dehydrogenase
MTEPITVEVEASVPEGEKVELDDIAPPVSVKQPDLLLVWLAGALAVSAGLAVLGVFIERALRRRRRLVRAAAEAVDPRSPDEIAQGRLGPGRIHHCMRLIGLAERALEKMCKRATQRVAFGRTVAEQGVTRERIAEARIMIDSAHFMVLHAAWKMDTVGNKAARKEIAMIKVLAPSMACQVIDWAMQVHGGMGYSRHKPFEHIYRHHRRYRITEGSEEIQMRKVGAYLFGYLGPKKRAFDEV